MSIQFVKTSNGFAKARFAPSTKVPSGKMSPADIDALKWDFGASATEIDALFEDEGQDSDPQNDSNNAAR